MENIDMEAIARKFGIWGYVPAGAWIGNRLVGDGFKCQCGYKYIIPIKSKCPKCNFQIEAQLHPDIYRPVTPNFREPEWLVRLMSELARRGYNWERTGKLYVIRKRGPKEGMRVISEHSNWIDAFLLAVTKLAKEG